LISDNQDIPADRHRPRPDPFPIGGVPAVDKPPPSHRGASAAPAERVGSVRRRDATLRTIAVQPSSSPRSANRIRSTSHSVITAVSIRSSRAAIVAGEGPEGHPGAGARRTAWPLADIRSALARARTISQSLSVALTALCFLTAELSRIACSS